MNLLKYFALTFLIHGCACTGVMAQTVGKQLEFNSAMGVQYESNLVKNPSAYKNNLYSSSNNSTITRDTDAADRIDGVASWLIDATALNGWAQFTLLNESSEQTSGNCGFSGIYKGDASLYSAQILDSLDVVLARVPLTNETGWREFKVWHPCGASGARKVRITQTEAGTAPAINVGRLFYGRMEPGAGVPPNTFTAKVSATGVVSDETGGDWINGNCTNVASPVCTFVSGFATSTPNCVISVQGSTNTSNVIFAVSTTGFTIRGFVSTTITSDGATVSCTKTGSDYIQPAITPNQWNYGRTLYTPTFGAGFGTVTSPECYHSRDGEFLYVDCKFTTGTVSGSAANVSLPPGLSAVTNTTGTKSVGTWFRSASGTTHGGSVLIGSGSTVISFSGRGVFGSDAVAALTAGIGTEIVGSTEALHFTAKIPIAGWTENQGAPQLVNSVITQYNGVNSKIESELNCDASSAITSQSGGISTIGNRSGNTCALTLTSGVFTATPWKCQVTVKSTTVQATGCTCSSATSCTIAGPSADFDAYVSIEGPK